MHKWLLLAVSGISGAAFADNAQTVVCKYVFMSQPIAQIQLGISADGQPDSSALIWMGIGAPSHQETVTPDNLAVGEKIHIWLSKDVPDDAVEMVVYSQRQPKGDSKIVNPQMPMDKEIWGDCTFSQSPAFPLLD